MMKHDYLACDGGPHLVLPVDVANSWSGAGVTGLGGDYARATATISTREWAMLAIGGGRGILLNEPAFSAWGNSPEGWIDIYSIAEFTSKDIDAVVDRAVAAVPTAAMVDTHESITLRKPDLFLLFAGDTPTSTAYGVYRIPLVAGTYSIFHGHYEVAGRERVEIYRLRPSP